MYDVTLEQIERQVAGVAPEGAPPALRAAVLADVHRELRAARWDRRLARAAALLLVVGVGMNLAAGLQSENIASKRPRGATQANSRRSLVETAIVVAEATDARTGRHFARQLAAMTGHRLTVDEAAAIDAAIGNRPGDHSEDKKG
jgi:hypothetical protein